MKQDLARRCSGLFELDQQSHHERKTYYGMLQQSTSQGIKRDQSPKGRGQQLRTFGNAARPSRSLLTSFQIWCPEVLPKAIGSADARYVLCQKMLVHVRSFKASSPRLPNSLDDCYSSKFCLGPLWSSRISNGNLLNGVWVGGGDDDKRESMRHSRVEQLLVSLVCISIRMNKYIVDCRRIRRLRSKNQLGYVLFVVPALVADLSVR